MKAGADFAVIAKSNPDDPAAAKGGDAGTIDEYANQAPGQFSMSLSLLYGKDFADAVQENSIEVISVPYQCVCICIEPVVAAWRTFVS